MAADSETADIQHFTDSNSHPENITSDLIQFTSHGNQKEDEERNRNRNRNRKRERRSKCGER